MKRTICLLTALLLLCCVLPVMDAHAESVGEMVDTCPHCSGTEFDWFPIFTSDGRDAHRQMCVPCQMLVGGYEYCEPDLETATCVNPPSYVVCGVPMYGTMQADPDKHVWSEINYLWNANDSGYDVWQVGTARTSAERVIKS